MDRFEELWQDVADTRDKSEVIKAVKELCRNYWNTAVTESAKWIEYHGGQTYHLERSLRSEK